MVFVPVTPAAALALRDGRPALGAETSVRGFAGTPSLRAALGADAGEEEADYAALSAAGVAALDGAAGSRRLVVAVEVSAAEVTDRRTGLGEVGVARVRWDQVRALFADEDEAADAVAAASAVAVGVPVGDALALPAVVALTDTGDLLWYAPDELDALT